MFLTLQLCQLTQPYGSLLFRKSTGWFWRVSPVASFAEGCVILVYLVLARDVPVRKWGGFRVAAAALLLLRDGSVGESTNDPERNQLTNADENGEEDTGRPVFDKPVLAHKQWRIALFTALSVLLVFIKMSAVKGVPWFTAPAAMFLVFGWIMVQMLLLLLNWKDMTEAEDGRITRQSKDLKSLVDEGSSLWQVYYIISHLPLIGYAAWYLAFKISIPESWWVVRGIVSFLVALFWKFLVFPFFIVIVYLLIDCCRVPEENRGKHHHMCGAFLFRLLGVACCLYGMVACGYNMYYEMRDFKEDYYNQVSPRQESIWVFPLRYCFEGIYFLAIVGFIVTIFCVLIFWVPHGPSETNFGLTVVLFSIYLAVYDPSGTWKPDWLDWLG